MREVGKLLLILGIVLAVVGAVLWLGVKLPFRLGRLPGEVVWRGERGSFYFPIVTCLLFSATMTMLFWIVERFRR